MNAVTNNSYAEGWRPIGERTVRPKAILSVSAHWFVPETGVTLSTAPKTIHDCGGFRQELYRIQYPAPVDPELARHVQRMLAPLAVRLDDKWGLDHGTWSVLRHVYPNADVPIVQLSTDKTSPHHFILSLVASSLYFAKRACSLSAAVTWSTIFPRTPGTAYTRAIRLGDTLRGRG